MTNEIEYEFHDAMITIYHQKVDECHYYHTDFLQTVARLGGLNAAKQLLATDQFSTGLSELAELCRLDLSMEVLILKKEWSKLFTDEEITTAKQRLNRYGYDYD